LEKNCGGLGLSAGQVMWDLPILIPPIAPHSSFFIIIIYHPGLVQQTK
jgi:hypothetical protein